jgi:hypothetical protein
MLARQKAEQELPDVREESRLMQRKNAHALKVSAVGHGGPTGRKHLHSLLLVTAQKRYAEAVATLFLLGHGKTAAASPAKNETR